MNSHLRDTGTFLRIFMGFLLQPQNQIVLDEAGLIEKEYVTSISTDDAAYEKYKIWEMAIKSDIYQGKVLITSPGKYLSLHDYVVSSISCAITTNDKSILTLDNNLYSQHMDKLSRQRIHLFGVCHLNSDSSQSILGKHMSFTKLDYDIAWSLERLLRLHKKGHKEDDLNDLLREYLLAKDYDIKDQTREGLSSSGKSAGELDIIIEHNKSMYAIVEAMKLSQINKDYIFEHYKKMLVNYNPLDIKRLFLITYYEGKKFDDWWDSYTKYIDEITYNSLNPKAQDCFFSKTELIDTKFGNVKKLLHHGLANNESFNITHYAVRI